MIVYRALFANGKSYIGQTISALSARVAVHLSMAAHGSRKLPRFYNAIRKYGAPRFELLCRACSRSALDAAEIAYIRLYDANGDGGYNCKAGGYGGALSEETKRKLRGRKMPASAIAKTAAANRGRIRSAETRAKIAAAAKARAASLANSKVMAGQIKATKLARAANIGGQGRKGIPHSSAVRAKISASLIGNQNARK